MQYGMFYVHRREWSCGQESAFETRLHQTAHTDACTTYHTAHTTTHVSMRGRICDSAVFLHSSSYNALQNGQLYLPQQKVPPGNEMPAPYVLVADDAFLLTTNLMKSYAGESTKGSLKTLFNYKLTKACHIVENSLGLLASVFNIFHKPLSVKPSMTEDITQACKFDFRVSMHHHKWVLLGPA